MNKLACRYAILRFLPYTETGEFANVGVVLACPVTGFFGFKLETRRASRFTKFFRGLDRNVYLRAIDAFRNELERVRAAYKNASDSALRDAFTALIHPREAILRFGDARVTLVADPEHALQQLYARYVEHDFVRDESHEREMERRVQQVIKGLLVAHPFREERVGDDDFAVRFPFVQVVNNRPTKIIKPFFLAQNETADIFNHGDVWLGKLKRLRQRRLLPDNVLFAIESPEESDGKRFQAYDDVRKELSDYAEVTMARNEASIVNFAQRL